MCNAFKTDNKDIMINEKVDKVINKLFKSPLNRYEKEFDEIDKR